MAGIDSTHYLARLQTDPQYRSVLPNLAPTARVLVAGYHAAFATPPRPGAPIGVFPGVDPDAARAGAAVVMALVRIEYATRVTVDADGGSRDIWQQQLFDRLPTGYGWRLLPAQLDERGRWLIARGNLAASGLQALLPRSVSIQVPGAPVAVAVHDLDPHTGRRWPW
ncbi:MULTISPECIES: hypothetical protein [Nocardia]|uniref:DUF4262 domain-containing protein n=1 Tax=Nocardia sputorum TaxID=2984338 RepID=A0ABM8D0X1_9NOCA|nr:hypothetical protein [Nocardia sputorum]BDU00981.1 hypothetical protein IFM12276_40090 [Nocardia sputorum]